MVGTLEINRHVPIIVSATGKQKVNYVPKQTIRRGLARTHMYTYRYVDNSKSIYASV